MPRKPTNTGTNKKKGDKDAGQKKKAKRGYVDASGESSYTDR